MHFLGSTLTLIAAYTSSGLIKQEKTTDLNVVNLLQAAHGLVDPAPHLVIPYRDADAVLLAASLQPNGFYVKGLRAMTLAGTKSLDGKMMKNPSFTFRYAISLLQAEPESSPHHADALLAISNLCFRLADVEQAFEYAVKSIKSNPSNLAAHRMRLNFALNRGNITDIRTAQRQMVAVLSAIHQPNPISVGKCSGLLGGVYLDQGEYVEAMQRFKEEFAAFASNSQSDPNLAAMSKCSQGEVYIRLRLYENAVSVYNDLRAAIESKPFYREDVKARFYLRLAQALVGQGDTSKLMDAEECLGKVAAILKDKSGTSFNPELARVNVFLAICAERKGDLKRAQKYYDDAMTADGFDEKKVSPGRSSLLLQLVKFHIACNELGRAQEKLQLLRTELTNRKIADREFWTEMELQEQVLLYRIDGQNATKTSELKALDAMIYKLTKECTQPSFPYRNTDVLVHALEAKLKALNAKADTDETISINRRISSLRKEHADYWRALLNVR